jgi:hypothetical protein
MGHVREHLAQLIKLRLTTRCAIRDEVPGEDDRVGFQRLDPLESAYDVFVAHARTDMQVTDLCEARSLELAREAVDRQVTRRDLEPVRFQADGVSETPETSGRDTHGSALQKIPSIQCSPGVPV